jgi:hypothetical protein
MASGCGREVGVSEQSWVETTCPPGWVLSPSKGREWWSPCRAEFNRKNVSGFANAWDGDGCTVWCPSEAAANRLAWERWALDVLGDRVTWTQRGDGRPRTIFAADPGPWVYVRHPFHGPIFEIYADAETDADGEYLDHGCMVSWTRDPVEALARLAALTLAVLGPEVK